MRNPTFCLCAFLTIHIHAFQIYSLLKKHYSFFPQSKINHLTPLYNSILQNSNSVFVNFCVCVFLSFRFTWDTQTAASRARSTAHTLKCAHGKEKKNKIVLYNLLFRVLYLLNISSWLYVFIQYRSCSSYTAAGLHWTRSPQTYQLLTQISCRKVLHCSIFS